MSKYKVEYLPLAMQDMIEIASYICHTLENPDAAEKLAEELVSAENTLEKYPYKNRVYHPVKDLTHEYHRVPVGNYGMYYWIDEDTHTVTIARVIYQRRDIDRLLE